MHLDDATRALTEEVLRRSCQKISCANSALWLASNDHLEPVLGYGPHAENFIGQYRHPLSEGIISMVHASGQPFCENNIATNPHHSSRLDQMLAIQTDAMIAMPVVYQGNISGVITFVHTSHSNAEAAPQEFSAADMEEAEYAAALTNRILDAANHSL